MDLHLHWHVFSIQINHLQNVPPPGHEEVRGEIELFASVCADAVRITAPTKYPVPLSSNTNTSCASCANFSILKQTLSHCPSLSVSLLFSHQKFHDKPYLLPEYVSCAYIRHHAGLTPDSIGACGESLFEDKGFPRLRRAAGGCKEEKISCWLRREGGGRSKLAWHGFVVFELDAAYL